MNHVLAGFLSGLAATVPMSAVMEAGHAKLPLHQRYSLPPPRIEERARRKVGLSRGGRTADHRALAIVLHFAFGGSAGAVYGGVADRLPGPVLAKSVGFGVGVWAASYLLGLPALGLGRHAAHEPAQRNALMIGAHVVWGAGLSPAGLLLHVPGLRERHHRSRRGLRLLRVPDGVRVRSVLHRRLLLPGVRLAVCGLPERAARSARLAVTAESGGTSPRREFRRQIGSDTWHVCANCTLWPSEHFESVVNATPAAGVLCTLCIGLRKAGACAPVAQGAGPSRQRGPGPPALARRGLRSRRP